jgi:regulator of extracellular matrix RemA (YlzA/DUF370 family)
MVSGLLLMILVTACSGGNDMSYVFSSEVSEKLSVLSQKGPQGATIQLSDVTSFHWNKVHIFPESSSGKIINQNVGQKMFDDDAYYGERGTLMVFTDQDKIVHALSFAPPLYFDTGKKFTYSPQEAIVVAHTKDPGPYSLSFKE